MKNKFANKIKNLKYENDSKSKKRIKKEKKPEFEDEDHLIRDLLLDDNNTENESLNDDLDQITNQVLFGGDPANE